MLFKKPYICKIVLFKNMIKRMNKSRKTWESSTSLYKEILVFLPVFLLISLCIVLSEASDFILWKGANYFNDEALSLEEYEEIRNGFLGSKYEVSFFNERENLHMNDVARLIKTGSILFLAFFVLFIMHSEKIKKISFKSSFITFLIFIIFIILFFQILFSSFHKLFFEEGSWLFPSSSLLIRAFPFDFFVLMILRALFLGFLLSYAILAKRD
ncbi:MAG: hypothetical protein PWQ28_235 [Candidatus Woesearchaeota archaeon]|nr:hypothetical protein [Candidatus Woesearchaeota archaeon]MDK2907560.1 hypothetical protein [Candidatus Woesearchaeota archaeon]